MKREQIFPEKAKEKIWKSLQSRKPVCRHTAFRTCRRSLPFKVLPTPSRTECASIGDCAAELLATISCGGSISASPSSSSSSSSTRKKSRCLLIAFARTGTFTGADWWHLTEDEGTGVMRSWGGLGITGIRREEEEDEDEDEDTEALW